MVKLPHQKHSRNISTVSDISMGERNEPLRRDQKADIKCILLCDSTTEQQEFKKAFEKAIFQLDKSPNSGISLVPPKVPLILFFTPLFVFLLRYFTPLLLNQLIRSHLQWRPKMCTFPPLIHGIFLPIAFLGVDPCLGPASQRLPWCRVQLLHWQQIQS